MDPPSLEKTAWKCSVRISRRATGAATVLGREPGGTDVPGADASVGGGWELGVVPAALGLAVSAAVPGPVAVEPAGLTPPVGATTESRAAGGTGGGFLHRDIKI
jgi:hypothetical protein